jgi:hypothetical protein
LKWAPEIGAKIVIITYNIAPVAIAFAKRTTPSLLGDKLLAIMPDPTTLNTSIRVPMYSAKSF